MTAGQTEHQYPACAKPRTLCVTLKATTYNLKEDCPAFDYPLKEQFSQLKNTKDGYGFIEWDEQNKQGPFIHKIYVKLEENKEITHKYTVYNSISTLQMETMETMETK